MRIIIKHLLLTSGICVQIFRDDGFGTGRVGAPLVPPILCDLPLELVLLEDGHVESEGKQIVLLCCCVQDIVAVYR